MKPAADAFVPKMPTCFDFAAFETVELISGAESEVTETSPAAVIVVFLM